MNKYQATLTLNQKVFLNADSLGSAKELLNHLIQEYILDDFVNVEVKELELLNTPASTTYSSLSSYYNNTTPEIEEPEPANEDSSYVPYRKEPSETEPTYTRLTQTLGNS
jgi:hypothetical protein